MDEAILTIRESNRSILNINRRRLRNEESDVYRSLLTSCITSESVADIANKLKTKSLVTDTDLRNLKNALVDNEKNIEIVLNIYGALRGLVKELSGHNERKQCEAAACCCNLALGSSEICVIITKVAGPYIISALNNLNNEFAVTCIWTLSNLAGSGMKTCELLVAQGAIGKLTDQLTILNQDLSKAAIETLTQFAYQLKDELSTKHFQGILSKLQELPVGAASLNLLFILSCHKDFSTGDLCLGYTKEIVETFFITLSTPDHGNIDNLIYLIRILANFDNIIVYEHILNYFVSNNMLIRLKELLNSYNKINENLLWLLGNMFNVYPNHEFFTHLIKW